jgi:GTP cyclohydrolase IA
MSLARTYEAHEGPKPQKITRRQEIQHAVRTILYALGYDTENEHFARTPERVADLMLKFAANGSDEEAAELLGVKFDANLSIDSLVIEGPIRFISFCAHHMSQITGVAYVGYLPNQHICGLSKMARVVRHYSRQYSVQELVTERIINAIETNLKPLGCMVVVQAQHSCMSVRGVEEPYALTTTSAVRGVHKESPAARNEFLSLIAQGAYGAR